MQQLPKLHKITLYCASFITSSLLAVNPVIAEPSGLVGNYWGKSLDQYHPLDLGRQFLLETTQTADPIIHSIINADLPQLNSSQSDLTGSFQGRLDLPNTQLSIRGTATINKEAINLIPTISYDVPVSNNANVYAGAGYSVERNMGNTANQINQEAMVLTTGVETAVGQKMIVYGDAKFELDAHDRGDRSLMKLQIGAGYRF